MSFAIRGSIRPSDPCKGIRVRKRIGRFEFRVTDDLVEFEGTSGNLEDGAWSEAQVMADKFARLLGLRLGNVSISMSQAEDIRGGVRTISAQLACFVSVVDSATVEITNEEGQVDSQGIELETQKAAEWATEFLPLADDQTFLRSLGYLQESLSKPEECLAKLSKAIEAVENYFGGERQAGRTLQMLDEIKYVKRLANEPLRDERHAPGPNGEIVKISDSERNEAIDLTRRFIAAFLTHIRGEKEAVRG